jgi:hypothetical protein
MATEHMTPPMIMRGTIARRLEPAGIQRYTVRAPKPPIMKISPWAKLMSWMIP